MPTAVSHGASLRCSCGLKTGKLRVDHRGAKSGTDGSLAVIDDCLPLVNIPPFGGCRASANPFPAPPGSSKPCMPRFSTKWTDEVASITLQGKKLVEKRATLTCDYGGTVSIVDSGQTEVKLREDLMNNPIGGGKK